jgi:hypothetical protein
LEQREAVFLRQQYKLRVAEINKWKDKESVNGERERENTNGERERERGREGERKAKWYCMRKRGGTNDVIIVVALFLDFNLPSRRRPSKEYLSEEKKRKHICPASTGASILYLTVSLKSICLHIHIVLALADFVEKVRHKRLRARRQRGRGGRGWGDKQQWEEREREREKNEKKDFDCHSNLSQDEWASDESHQMGQRARKPEEKSFSVWEKREWKMWENGRVVKEKEGAYDWPDWKESRQRKRVASGLERRTLHLKGRREREQLRAQEKERRRRERKWTNEGIARIFEKERAKEREWGREASGKGKKGDTFGGRGGYDRFIPGHTGGGLGRDEFRRRGRRERGGE